MVFEIDEDLVQKFGVTSEKLEFYESQVFRSLNRETSDEIAKTKLEAWDKKVYNYVEQSGRYVEVKNPDLKDDFWSDVFCWLILHFALYGTISIKDRFTSFANNVFVSFEFFERPGNKNLINIVFRRQIGQILQNKDNVFINMLKNKGLAIKEEFRKYMFSKGYLLGGNVDDIKLIKEDLDFIFKNWKTEKLYPSQFKLLQFESCLTKKERQEVLDIKKGNTLYQKASSVLGAIKNSAYEYAGKD